MSEPEKPKVTLGQVNACPYCEKSHVGQCPKVRAIEYYPDGFTVRRIEFHREQREDR